MPLLAAMANSIADALVAVVAAAVGVILYRELLASPPGGPGYRAQRAPAAKAAPPAPAAKVAPPAAGA